MEVLHENGHEIRTASLVSLQSPLTALHPSPKPEASSNSPPLEIAPLMETFDILNPRSLQESLPLNHALHCLFPDKNAMGRYRAYFQGTLNQAIRDLAEPVGNPNQDPGMFDDFFNRFTHMFPGTGPNFYGDSATVDVQNVIDLVVMRWACDYLCGFGQVLDIPRNSGALATRLNGLDAVFG
ncbi:hypothetical protein BDN72DRAFT_170313 [Pluteus cervinus]|uniref:Uncharacterized protein n=1 Tax=Pluteus cervinus TaxID=181527 RepID=A0ACD3AJD4_9AGAR|nr:hypothetical protein BDN72DRAFT_170313 [Pluteus cervinus]